MDWLRDIIWYCTRRRHELMCAVNLICHVHTSQNDSVGFRVDMGATPRDKFILYDLYVKSWRVLREEAGLPVDPVTRGQRYE